MNFEGSEVGRIRFETGGETKILKCFFGGLGRIRFFLPCKPQSMLKIVLKENSDEHNHGDHQ